MSENRSKSGEMSSAEAIRSEVRGHLRLIAGLALEDSRKAALRFVAMVLRLPHDRVKRLYYGEARRIEAHEADRIRAFVEQAHKLITAREDYETLRRRYLADAHPLVAQVATTPKPAPEVGEVAEAPVKRRARR